MDKHTLKIDKYYRIAIPKDLIKILNLQDEVSYEIDVSRGTLTLFNSVNRSIKESIDVRLNRNDITKSERNFLEKLLKNLDLK